MRTRKELVSALGSLTANTNKIQLEVMLDLRELLRDIRIELSKLNDKNKEK